MVAVNTDIPTWLATKDDPRVGAIRRLCDIVESADARVQGEIKWHAPSYFVGTRYATTGLNPKGGVRMVLHRGAKKVPGLTRPDIDDPEGLLEWRADDRAVLNFVDDAEVELRSDAVGHLVRQWLDQT